MLAAFWKPGESRPSKVPKNTDGGSGGKAGESRPPKVVVESCVRNADASSGASLSKAVLSMKVFLASYNGVILSIS